MGVGRRHGLGCRDGVIASFPKQGRAGLARRRANGTSPRRYAWWVIRPNWPIHVRTFFINAKLSTEGLNNWRTMKP
jgi:hypothetical protein